MRALLFTVALALVASAVSAQPQRYFQVAPRLEARLMQQIGPQTRAWIVQEGQREARYGALSEETAFAAVAAHARFLGDPTGSDIEALVFLVMMEAANSAEDDLSIIKSGVRIIDHQEGSQRQAEINSGIVGAMKAAADLALWRPASPVGIRSQPLTRAEFDNQFESARSSKDALNDMRGREELRLQMALDRCRQAMEALSGILSEVAETDATIIGNLK